MTDLLNQLLRFHAQARLLHWQTTSYARHIAYGKLYDDLGDQIDDLVETIQGKYPRLKVDGPILVDNLGDGDAALFLEELVDYLIGLSEVFPEPSDSDLLNKRDEMLASANRIRYLLSLS